MTAPTYAEWAASKRAGEWQPIETAPDDRVLLVGWWSSSAGYHLWEFDVEYREGSPATHWLDLPPPPASPGTNATGASEARGGKVGA